MYWYNVLSDGFKITNPGEVVNYEQGAVYTVLYVRFESLESQTRELHAVLVFIEGSIVQCDIDCFLKALSGTFSMRSLHLLLRQLQNRFDLCSRMLRNTKIAKF